MTGSREFVEPFEDTGVQPDSVYEQIGGSETVRYAMRVLFRELIPEDETLQPPLRERFGTRLTDEQSLTYHERSVGAFMIAVLGGRGHDQITPDLVISKHTTMPPEVFDTTAGLMLAAFERAGEDLLQPTELVSEAVAPVIPILREGMVEPSA